MGDVDPGGVKGVTYIEGCLPCSSTSGAGDSSICTEMPLNRLTGIDQLRSDETHRISALRMDNSICADMPANSVT